jgi:subtilisin family serine protease
MMHTILGIFKKTVARPHTLVAAKPTRLTDLLAALMAAALLANSASAATVAIIDSGVDNEHAVIAPHMWVNSGEVIGNGRDDDWNAYVDDIFGWNFADQNPLIIDRSFLGSFTEFPYRFFEAQEKLLRGTITPEEQEWMRQAIAIRENQQELQKFGNFVHGTHVAGIVQSQSEDATIMALKIIPTVVKLPFSRTAALVEGFAKSNGAQVPLAADTPLKTREKLIKGLLFALAQAQGLIMGDVGKYLHRQNIAVANGSFGVSVRSAVGVITPVLRVLLGRPANDEEIQTYSRYFVSQVIKSQSVLADSSKDTLFVFAAGNDGTNNDTDGTSPANIKRDNTLAVAATNGVANLATFSNFGSEMVDVAAPGVAIRSISPGNEYLVLSGTSQAAPFVAGVATQIRSINPSLTPADTKKIIKETVEKIATLVGKVNTGGVVNPARAMRAAELSRSLELSQAIAQANTQLPQGSLSDIQAATTHSEADGKAHLVALPTGF